MENEAKLIRGFYETIEEIEERLKKIEIEHGIDVNKKGEERSTWTLMWNKQDLIQFLDLVMAEIGYITDEILALRKKAVNTQGETVILLPNQLTLKVRKLQKLLKSRIRGD